MVELNQLRVARKSFSKSVFCSSKIAVFFEVIKSVAVNYVFHYFGARTKEGNGSVVLDVVFLGRFYVSALRLLFSSGWEAVHSRDTF